MSTFISGCASVQAIDTAGEIVDLKGIDITSLARTGIINFEHDQGKDAEGKPITLKLPAQIVGKIIKAKKIFDGSSCSTPNETYFWNKTKIPFLYIIAELLDDYCDGAKECAGKFKYSKDRPGQQPILGFSVEGSELPGSRIDKMLIGRSIARKVTLTATPANHMCIAEIYEEAMDSVVKDDFESLFRSEEEAITLFKSDQGSILYDQFLMKAAPDFKNAPKFGPATKLPKMPGISIGQTKSGKEVMSHLKPADYKGWSPQDHREAGNMHYKNSEEGKGVPGATHFDTAKRHLAVANKGGATPKPTMSKNEKPLNKALEAGSTNAAPSALSGGAVYQTENLSKPKKKTDWNQRSKEEYERWPQKDKFEKFMSQRMPHLALGEIKAIGRTIALQKSLELEKALGSLVKSETPATPPAPAAPKAEEHVNMAIPHGLHNELHVHYNDSHSDHKQEHANGQMTNEQFGHKKAIKDALASSTRNPTTRQYHASIPKKSLPDLAHQVKHIHEFYHNPGDQGAERESKSDQLKDRQETEAFSKKHKIPLNSPGPHVYERGEHKTYPKAIAHAKAKEDAESAKRDAEQAATAARRKNNPFSRF